MSSESYCVWAWDQDHFWSIVTGPENSTDVFVLEGVDISAISAESAIPTRGPGMMCKPRSYLRTY